MADDAINIRVNPDDLTFGDMVDFEEVSGIPVTEIGEGMSSKGLLALVWISARRDDPSFTLEQAREIKVSSVDFTDPTTPEESGTLQPLEKPARARAKTS